MISRNQIKHLSSLQKNKYRYIHREFIAEGSKMVLDLLSSEFNIRTIFATTDWLENTFDKGYEKNLQIVEVSEDELSKVSGLTTANEVLAIVQMPEWKLDMEIVSNELVLVLDTIRDPGNLGTIIRTADWFGINNIICSNDSVDVYNPKVVQATMGSVARVKVHYENLNELLSKVNPETKVYGTFMDGEDISEKKLKDSGLIIIGSEANGISQELYPSINERIGIRASERGKSESLNAAVACSIVLYEFCR